MIHKVSKLLILIVFALMANFCPGCSSSDENNNHSRMRHQKGEYIYRKQGETQFAVDSPEKIPNKVYPWDKMSVGNHPPITKEYFRCKGSSLNPCHSVLKNNELQHCYDCGGIEKHSLPLCNGKEHIYPILIDLLNHIQATTSKRVVITCGHRCTEHNTYADPSTQNQYSKHMIGAEVSFYVQGMEEHPEIIVKYIQDFYRDKLSYQGKKEYTEFRRYEKDDTNVSTQPWYNKEVFVKLFNKNEGRNFDNRHPYPYISIQVRYDRDLGQNVNYSWDKAYRNYLRW